VPAYGKILVIRGGAIGDFVLTLPVFAALRHQFPGVPIEVLGYPHIAQLAWAGRLVDRVQSIEARALAGFFARGGILDPALWEYFASFALIISYLFDPDQIFRKNVARCSKAQFIAGPHRPDESGSVHATQVFLKPLERLAIFEPDPVPRLRIDRQQLPRDSMKPVIDLVDCLGTPSARWLAMHPGSGSENKNWPEKNWTELLVRLAAETDWDFFLIGGEAEAQRPHRLAEKMPASRVRVAQSRPLPELAWLLQQSAFYLGHDSGISHLAASLGLQAAILWGKSNLSVWGPLADNVSIIGAGQELAELAVHDVLTHLRPK